VKARHFAVSLLLVAGIASANAETDDPRVQKALDAIKALNDSLRRQVEVAKVEAIQQERTGRKKDVPDVGIEKVPDAIAGLVRSLENHLGAIPATVVIDGSYVEVIPVDGVSDSFLKALAAVSREQGGIYDLQVEQLDKNKDISNAERFRRSLSKYGVEDGNLALVSRVVTKDSRERFTFAPRRKSPRLSSEPPPVKVAGKSVEAAPQTKVDAGSDRNEPVMSVAPELTPAGAKAKVAVLKNPEVKPVKANPTSSPSVKAAPLPEPGVIVVELPRDRGKVQSQNATVVGVIAAGSETVR
jgi:hypothetical protein